MSDSAIQREATDALRRGMQTRDVDIARKEIGRLFCPHQLRPSAQGLDVRVRAHHAGPIALVGLDYGHRVRITPGELRTFYLIQVPLAGSTQIGLGKERLVSTPSVAAVLSPNEPVDMLWSESAPHLLCRIERRALHEELQMLTGEVPSAPIRFQAAMPLTAPGVRTWLDGLRTVWHQLQGQAPRTADWHRSVLTTLLLTQPHNHSALLQARAGDASAVRRAVAFMEQRLGGSVNVPEVAAAVGVGVRGLQRAFRAELDTTPAAWLKRRRLSLARERLLAAEPGSTTVTVLAGQCGITHLGRFAADYQTMFGEHPSDSLARPAEPVRV
ncbi:AraC family transcriptional regulator [Granulicoccus sp. GXG6511]|uniref:AraC family transcriptional regulator n=1 Tax=Granulicoccus sp. GXG6511 TaxID=3381351 RepID=UPI003D7DFC3F